MDSYNKIWSVIRNTDLLNGDEKIELHLYLMNLNEHDKKQKEVIDKATKYINDEIKREAFHHYLDDKDIQELLDILKEVE